VIVNVTPREPHNLPDGRFEHIRRLRIPAAIAALAGLAEIVGEPARLALRYQRDLVADGELWRLLAGHLVHLGPSHMAMNVVALAIMTWIIGRLFQPMDWLWVSLISAVAIDAGLYWGSAEISWYVGLSGLLHGCWAGASIRAWEKRRKDAALLSALLLTKLGYEAWFGPLSVTGEIAAGPVVAIAHTYGAIGGALWALASLAIRKLPRPL
jgi:rhomboid family GlyGly-CTERM serine protease